ncbi:MAG: xanthine dehydrogenase subunit XdhA [Nitrospinota bacterium]
MEELKVVGHSLPLKDAADKAVGTGLYTVDMTLPGMLYGKILRSPHAHARILNVDASKARKLPGVRAVITPGDVPRNQFTTAGHPPPDPTPSDQFILDHKVRYVGDKVAAVAADSNDIAMEALDLIQVDYEVLPAVFDPMESIAEGAPDIHENLEHGKNTAGYVRMEEGDVEKGFAEADCVFETECKVPGQSHSMLEPVAALCHHEANGKLTVWSSTQIPFTLRRLIHDALGIPVRKIRVLKPIVGGGFGCKQDMQEEPLCALLSKAAGRPVKLEYTREETFCSSRIRHPYVLRSKTGLRKDGAITARHLHAVGNTGAFSSHGPIVTAYMGAMWIPLYRSPHFLFEGRTVYTNLAIAGAFRGYGVPQGTYACELHMDSVAKEMGIDPLDLRRKNHAQSGDINPGTKWAIASCELRKCIDAGAQAIGWDEKRGKKQQADGKLHGVGAAIFTIASGAAPFALEASSATVRVLEDGGIQLGMGISDTGQGTETTMAQVAAETFGVSLDNVETNRVVDTDVSPYDNGAYATRQAYVAGMASKMAAADARRLVLEHASKMLEASLHDLDIVDGDVIVKSTPDKRISVGEVAFDAQYGENPHELVGRSDYTPPTNAPPFGAQFAEVEVDPETGEVELLNLIAAHDVGRALNPVVVEGQVQGGVTQGIGYGMMEEVVFDAETGRTLTSDFAQYEIPTSMDTPEILPLLVEEGEPTGPYGAKGVGEPGIVPTAPAIANAVFDAIGTQVTEIPVTAERVIEAIQGQKV